MNREIFIGSGAFIAFLVRRDRMHAEAVRLYSQPPPRWCTSVLVIAETYIAGLGKGMPSRVYTDVFDEVASLDVEGRTTPGSQVVQLYDVARQARRVGSEAWGQQGSRRNAD